ncbi:response regulator transcription factor [Anaerosporobacter sp.]|uniref:response regulator transcription factor n=1 Tax=Anaerosporobacter sp. TaxID=1872529 RepID=UPI00286F952F|nr:helix-turn-helix domain-containing protein [Anaerosporobacter sp.]
MYKIVIAERDSNYIEQIKGIIDREYRNCEITHIVDSSEATIELLAKEDSWIDIAIINIKLVGTDGLQTIRRIKKKNIETRIIVLSEFNYIEFIQEALRLKVDDYIIMPAEESRLSESIGLCLKTIVNMNCYKQNLSSVMTTNHEAEQYVEYSFIYTVAMSKLTAREIKKYIEILKIGTHGCIVNMEIEAEDGKQINKQNITQQVYECVHEYDGEMFQFVVGPRISRRIILYASYRHEKTEENNAAHEELLNIIKSDIEKRLQVKVYLGVGKTEEITNIYTSYQDSIRDLRNKKRSSDNDDEIEDVDAFHRSLYKDLEKNYLKSLRLKNGESSNYLNHLLDSMDYFSEEERRDKVIELLVLVRHTVPDFDWGTYAQDSFREYLMSIGKMPMQELKEWAYQIFECIQYSQVDQNRLYTKSVSDSVNIIDAEYMKNITLDEIARRVGVSSQYLSKIFKEETGQTLVEYLTSLRINRARELIQTSDQPIKQVGIMVGYKDPNYFSRIFRNVVGVSPSEFRDEVKNRLSISIKNRNS